MSYVHAGGAARGNSRIGHHANTLLSASIVGVVVVGFQPLPGLLFLILPLVLFGFVLWTWMLMRRHDRSLCEQCVSSMPLNPAARAQKLHRRFWMAHTGSEPRFLIPYFAVLIGSNFATTTIGRIGWAVMQLSMIYLIMSQQTHRKLQPWCPVCSQGGGGEKVEDVDPQPLLPNDDRLNA